MKNNFVATNFYKLIKQRFIMKKELLSALIASIFALCVGGYAFFTVILFDIKEYGWSVFCLLLGLVALFIGMFLHEEFYKYYDAA